MIRPRGDMGAAFMTVSQRQASGSSLAAFLLGIYTSSMVAQITWSRFSFAQNYHFFLRLVLVLQLLLILVVPFFSVKKLRFLKHSGTLVGSVGLFVLVLRGGGHIFWNTLFQALLSLVSFFAFSFADAAQPFLIKPEVSTYGSPEVPRVIVYGQQTVPQNMPVYANPTPPTYSQTYGPPQTKS